MIVDYFSAAGEEICRTLDLVDLVHIHIHPFNSAGLFPFLPDSCKGVEQRVLDIIKYFCRFSPEFFGKMIAVKSLVQFCRPREYFASTSNESLFAVCPFKFPLQLTSPFTYQ